MIPWQFWMLLLLLVEACIAFLCIIPLLSMIWTCFLTYLWRRHSLLAKADWWATA